MSGRIVYLSDIPASNNVKLFDAQPDMMGVKKIAELLGVNERTVRREISRGALKCAHVGTRVIVSKTALLEYLGEVVQ